VVLRNFLIALGGIAFIAGLTLATLWFTRAPATAGAVGQALAPPAVLAAARPLASGTLLKAADLTWKEVTTVGTVPGTIVRSPSTEGAFLGAVTRRAFASGEPLIESALVKSGDREFLSAVLLPGTRAVSIAVDAPQSVAGLVLPGDRVDVILTQSFAPDIGDPGRKSVGETVLKDIRVIAVDQWLSSIAKPMAKDAHLGTANSQIPGTITLELSDLEAERLLVAVQLGKVQLAVRALESSAAAQAAANDPQRPTWAADVSPALRMLGRDSPPPGVLRSPISPAGPYVSRSSIEVMHGSKTEMH